MFYMRTLFERRVSSRSSSLLVAFGQEFFVCFVSQTREQQALDEGLHRHPPLHAEHSNAVMNHVGDLHRARHHAFIFSLHDSILDIRGEKCQERKVRKKKKGIEMSLAQADAHQRKHGFKPLLQQAVDETLEKLGKKKKLRGIEPPKMNKTEAEFEVFLKARKSARQILDYSFQGIRLRWGGNMNYKADFSEQRLDGRIVLIEVKGAQIWDRDIVRFKGCRAEWKNWFDFEMWQKTEGQWNRLL